jgi:kynureninase
MVPEPLGPPEIPPGLPDMTWEHLTITLENGQVLTGWYGHMDRFVTVITPRGGSRTAGFGFLPPVVMARILLRQLAEDGLD